MRHSYKPDEEFYCLLEKYVTGEASPQEVARLDHVYEVYQRKATGVLTPDFRGLREKQLTQLMNAVSGEASEKNIPRRRLMRTAIRVAALLAVFLTVGLGAYFYLDREDDAVEEDPWYVVEAPLGSLYQVQLPDGTVVRLNALSRLTYPSSFQDDLREVHLTGEAYFDVTKNEDAPFVIKTDKMDIHVLGTVLNVKAYPDEETAETALISGSVRIVSHASPDETVVLKPNQKYVERHVKNAVYSSVNSVDASKPAAVDLEAPPAVVVQQNVTELTMDEHSDIPEETEWTVRRFTIRDEKLVDIAVRLERWYGVNLHFENKAVGQQKYSARFEDENLETLLKSLQLVTPFKYRKEVNGDIIIY